MRKFEIKKVFNEKYEIVYALRIHLFWFFWKTIYVSRLHRNVFEIRSLIERKK